MLKMSNREYFKIKSQIFSSYKHVVKTILRSISNVFTRFSASRLLLKTNESRKSTISWCYRSSKKPSFKCQWIIFTIKWSSYTKTTFMHFLAIGQVEDVNAKINGKWNFNIHGTNVRSWFQCELLWRNYKKRSSIFHLF